MYTPHDLSKAIDKLLSLPRGPRRWRAATELYLKFNMSSTPGMTAREEYAAVARLCKERVEQNKNKFGTSGDSNSDIRGTLEMPTGLRLMLNLVDPEINSKENAIKMFKEFTEFRTVEVI